MARFAFGASAEDLGGYSDQMPLLELRSLRKSFFSGSPRSPRRVDGLLGADLDVDQGEILGIVGRESSGKTTLLLCAAGLLRRDGGTIRWHGEIFAGGGPLPGLVYVPAIPTYYPFLSVRDVLHYYGAQAESSVHQARLVRDVASRLALADFSSVRVGDLDVETLKRLAVAQALVAEPTVIFLDGVLDNLGAGAAFVYRSLAHAAASGATIVAASRNAGFLAPVVTRVAIMDCGLVTGSFSAITTFAGNSPDALFVPSLQPQRHIAERVH